MSYNLHDFVERLSLDVGDSCVVSGIADGNQDERHFVLWASEYLLQELHRRRRVRQCREAHAMKCGE